MLSKGFMETIEEMWKAKDNDIDCLNDLLELRDKQIRMLSDVLLKNENFGCIHEEGEFLRGHRYCDDRCPLVEISHMGFKENDEVVTIPLKLMCRKPKNWSK